MLHRKIAVLGGGHGVSQLLRGLTGEVSVSAIITGADSGGSTAKFVQAGMFPPGDLTRAALALAPPSELVTTLTDARSVKVGNQCADSARNIILFDRWQRADHDIQVAIDAFSAMIGIQGRIIPSTLAPCDLLVRIEGVMTLRGEHLIDSGRIGDRTIHETWLEGAETNPIALVAIENADLIVLGPGDLYTSIVPVLLVPGVREAICRSKAVVVFVMNLMTKWGETYGFTPDDFVRIVRERAGRVDLVLGNCCPPDDDVIRVYAEAKAQPVMAPFGWSDIAGITAYGDALAEKKADASVYHSPQATVRALESVLSEIAS